jgi:hypothetical protein
MAEKPGDAVRDVLELLRQTDRPLPAEEDRSRPLSTEEIVETLKQAYGEGAVFDALARLREELKVMQDSDGNWRLRGTAEGS